MEVVSEVKMAENISLKQLDQGSIKLLDDQLTCSNCLDRFKDPRLLPCHHYFCKECIDIIVEFRLDELESNNKDQMSILCPECRRKYNINCAESLVPAFFINRFESIIKAIESHRRICLLNYVDSVLVKIIREPYSARCVIVPYVSSVRRHMNRCERFKPTNLSGLIRKQYQSVLYIKNH